MVTIWPKARRCCLPTLSICPQQGALAVVLIPTPPPSPSGMRAIQVCITALASVRCDSCWSEGKSKSLCTGQATKMGVWDKRDLVLGREAQHCLSWPPLPPAVLILIRVSCKHHRGFLEVRRQVQVPTSLPLQETPKAEDTLIGYFCGTHCPLLVEPNSPSWEGESSWLDMPSNITHLSQRSQHGQGNLAPHVLCRVPGTEALDGSIASIFELGGPPGDPTVAPITSPPGSVFQQERKNSWVSWHWDLASAS